MCQIVKTQIKADIFCLVWVQTGKDHQKTTLATDQSMVFPQDWHMDPDFMTQNDHN